MTNRFTNQLINESSPYLLQHAHNPVQWYPWGSDALNMAKELDKPILVSIGYSACHWCHVMERESFEDELVAAYMNDHFINIKIDREERPDLDQIYMDAVQAIAGNGGWPLNVFLTPDAKPFYGGTYYPPQKAYNRPSWKDVLTNIHTAWEERREELETQADNLVDHISTSSNLFKTADIYIDDHEPLFSTEHCEIITENILRSADKEQGGFGNAPKFPQTFTLQYLLAYGYHFRNEQALHHAEFSLQQMLNGGIYDQLAGGLARYSTDSAWLAPHFEKMLYDNALLVNVLVDAFQVTHKEIYADAIKRTLDFFIHEMQHSDGGFFAALDADSEGEEGKFYIWQKSEIEHLLGADADLYCKWYAVSEKGNWDGKNILHITNEAEKFSDEHKIDSADLKDLIKKGNKILLEKRNKRPRPITDDKILLGWNALLLTSLCKASAALGDETYKKAAISLYEFIRKSFSKDGIICFHTYKNNEAKHPAFLDDYAYLIQACIHLQEITSDQQYLLDAKQLMDHVILNFENKSNGFFYYTHQGQSDIITRKTEFYDGAIPSGNSIMADNLFYLSVVFDDLKYRQQAEKITRGLVQTVTKYPTSFAVWANIILKQVMGINEIVVSGKDISSIRTDILKQFIPNKVLQCGEKVEEFPLLVDKKYEDLPLIYLCRNYQCLQPVHKINELNMLLK